jgi:hypothetical protein
LIFQGFSRILEVVKGTRLGGFASALLGAVLGGCRENLSPPDQGSGADVHGPVVQIRPAQDTTVDPTGVLLVSVTARDQSVINYLNLIVAGGSFAFSPLSPGDTVAEVTYPIGLTGLSGSSLALQARAVDILNHETVTAPVTVTVR